MSQLAQLTKRLASSIQFGTENPMYGPFGDTTVPSIPKPDLPGYKTDEACQALLTEQAAKTAEDMRVKHALLGIGGVVVGIAIGAMIFRD